MGKAGILGGVAPVMADHHGGAHLVILIDGIHLAVCRRMDLGPGFGGKIHPVVHPPISGGLVVAQALHGVFR